MTPLETVQTIYSAFERGDVPAIIDLMSDDVQWKSWADAIANEELHLWAFGAHGKVTRLRHYTDTAKHIAAADVPV